MNKNLIMDTNFRRDLTDITNITYVPNCNLMTQYAPQLFLNHELTPKSYSKFYKDNDKVQMVCCQKTLLYSKVKDMVREMRDKARNIMKGQVEVVWGIWCCTNYLNYLPEPKIASRYDDIDKLMEYVLFDSHYEKYRNARRQDIEIAEVSGLNYGMGKFELIRSNAKLSWLLAKKN